MKRCWWGLVLLVVLLAGSLLSAWQMGRVHKPMADSARQAAAYALVNDWEKANALAQQARAEWEKRWDFSAAFANHAPMEQIDSLFARLEAYGKAKNSHLFAAVCADLGQALESIGDAQGLNWWNIF